MQGSFFAEPRVDLMVGTVQTCQTSELAFIQKRKWLPLTSYKQTGKPWPPKPTDLVNRQGVDGVVFDDEGKFYTGERLVEIKESDSVARISFRTKNILPRIRSMSLARSHV